MGPTLQHDNSPLPNSDLTVEMRSLQPSGFESGTWTFAIVVHAIHPSHTVETLLLTAPEVATVEVP
jgi:hypothetical protein